MSFKEGDKVVCIDRDNQKYLTIGKVYDVLDENSLYITILNDISEEHDFFLYRFRLATLLEKELSE